MSQIEQFSSYTVDNYKTKRSPSLKNIMLLMEAAHPEIRQLGRALRVLRDDAIVKRNSQLTETSARFCGSRAENHCHITNRIRWVT
jgi:hypothetical protein